MLNYKLTKDPKAVIVTGHNILKDGASIHNKSRYWLGDGLVNCYQDWLDAGNTPDPQHSQAELDEQDIATANRAEVQQQLADNILNNKSFADVDTYITGLFASATTAGAVKTAVVKVLKIYGKLILAIAKRQGLSD